MMDKLTHVQSPERYGWNQTSTGKEKVWIRFVVDGEAVYWDGYFTEKTQDATIKILKLFGCRLDSAEAVRSLEGFDLSTQVQIKIEYDDGKPRVRWINDPNEEPRTPSGDKISDEFAQSLVLRAAHVSQNEKAEEPDDTDIPF